MDKEQIIIKYSDELEQENPFAKMDPFNDSWDDLKELNGINTNFKRRTSRAENKVDKYFNIPTDTQGRVTGAYAQNAGVRATGLDGTSTKQLNPGEVFRNGYGLFDVITPPYNLYELASFYDTNFANHAAIDAKVSNTVGLGYKFDTSPDVVMKIESSSDEAAAMRAKKRIDRLKGDMREWLESLNDEDSFTTIMEKIDTDLEATGNGYLEVGRTVAGDIGYIGHIPSTTMRVHRVRDICIYITMRN